VHATPHYSEARYWGEYANADETHRRMTEIGRGRNIPQHYGPHHVYQPRVYEVHPTGPVEPDPNGEGQSYRSASPMRVGREVWPLQCYHCQDEGAEETEHAPGHPHYEYLRQESDEDDADREERGRYGSRGITASEDEDFEDAYEEPEPDLEPAGHERDEHDFIHPMVRDRESGERFPSPFEEPRCLNCERATGTEYRHRPEDGHPVPGVQAAIDKREQHERDLDEGRYDRTRYCDASCQRSHEEDQAHGISVHHTFAEGEPEHEDVRPREEMPQLSGPYDEPVGRSSGNYEVRNPSAEHRCHYCRSILPQYRREAALVPVYDTAAIDAAPALPCPPVDAVVDAVGLLGSWEPQDATDAAQGVIALKSVFEALHAVLGRVSRVIEEMPVSPDVAEGLYQMSLIARTAAEDCGRTAPALPLEASWEEPPAPPNR
jgi:hypothetical protein